MTPDAIWAAVRQPVEFARTIEGLTAGGGARFVDLGPSATLATFVKYLAAPGDGSTRPRRIVTSSPPPSR